MPGDPATPPSPDSQGYIFAPASGGHGYATEAVCAALGLAFGSLGARRVVARVDNRNAASSALLTRLGFRLEAHLVENEWLKSELISELDYAPAGPGVVDLARQSG